MQDKLKMAQQIMGAIPHAKALAMTIEEVGQGEAVVSMPYSEDLIGDPDTGVIHSGAIFALIDTCAGSAVLAHEALPKTLATLDLRIDYMRGATPGQRITARASCYHVTRSVAFVRATAHDEDAGAPVASAHGAFTINLGGAS